MNRDYEAWIVGGDSHAHQITADIAKIAGVTTLISIYFRWIQNYAQDLALTPALPAHFVPCMVAELHAPSRAWRGILSPGYARETPILRSLPSILAVAPLGVPS